ncbi:hypothetical protein [Haloferula sargassicola]|uniref:Uncharacterized protein n=1 Tax=Haloferula sargassicola TaxID=490096 RepID=A0ABP9UHP0_9BACT
MPYANLSAELSDAALQEVKTKIAEIQALLPFLIGLTPDERRTLPKMTTRTRYFTAEALEAARNHPNLVPPYVDLAELERDMGLFDQLAQILAPVAALSQQLDDTTLAAGSEAFTTALTLYNTYKRAAKDGAPGAQALADSLSARFEQSTRPQPTP